MAEEVPEEEREEEEEDSEDEQPGHLEMILHRIPINTLRDNLSSMRFARNAVQERLETLAPNYRMW